MNIQKIREDFPVASKHTYLDSACMSLKPKSVIAAMDRYYTDFPACGERSAHKLGRMVTEEFHAARKAVAKFIGAKEEEIIFTANTTHGLNLAAYGLLEKGDAVITSDKEHNSNFLPWTRYDHRIVPTKNGIFDMESFKAAIKKGAKIVSVLHASNIDGMRFPVKEIGKIAHDHGALLVLDGAQSVPHEEIDVKKLGCDVLAFSGHKMLGPSIGILHVKKAVAETMKPLMVGGGTVQNVKDGKPTFLKPPEVFEAGLQNYAGAIGLKAAIGYLESVGRKTIQQHERKLNEQLTEGLKAIPGVRILGGTPEERGGIVSFLIDGLDPKEAAIMFDSYNVLVRAGFHCCHNWFNAQQLPGSVRASLYLYNNDADVERFLEAAKKIAALRT